MKFLTDFQDIQDFATAVVNTTGNGAMVILDTLNRAAPTAEENSSKDMGIILEAAKSLQNITGGLVLLVHHTGSDVTKGLRGHSSLFAALDAALEVTRTREPRGQGRALTIRKRVIPCRATGHGCADQHGMLSPKGG